MTTKNDYGIGLPEKMLDNNAIKALVQRVYQFCHHCSVQKIPSAYYTSCLLLQLSQILRVSIAL